MREQVSGCFFVSANPFAPSLVLLYQAFTSPLTFRAEARPAQSSLRVLSSPLRFRPDFSITFLSTLSLNSRIKPIPQSVFPTDHFNPMTTLQMSLQIVNPLEPIPTNSLSFILILILLLLSFFPGVQ